MERRWPIQIRGPDLRNMTLPVLLVVLSANLKGLRIEFEQGQVLSEGDPCTLADNGTGVCSRLSDCPNVAQKIQVNQEPTICSFDKFVSFVCCPMERGGFPTTGTARPEASPLTTPSNSDMGLGLRQKSKSEEACDENYNIMLRVRNKTLPQECEEFYYDGPGVVGGEDAWPREFPHMAALGFGEVNSIQWLCGGSLISSRYVLTAAHCSVPRTFGTVRWVRLGDLNLESTTDDARPQQFSVAERIIHPDYKHPALYNDIALLRLDRDVIFNNYVRPACINTEHDLLGNVGEATGWGLTTSFGSTLSPILQKATLPVQHKKECERNYKSLKGTTMLSRGFEDDTMLCVGDEQGEMDTCKGDSGGPYHKEKDPKKCIHVVAGITSFGKTICGAVNSPAVYTRVSKFVPWIESVVWA